MDTMNYIEDSDVLTSFMQIYLRVSIELIKSLHI